MGIANIKTQIVTQADTRVNTSFGSEQSFQIQVYGVKGLGVQVEYNGDGNVMEMKEDFTLIRFSETNTFSFSGTISLTPNNSLKKGQSISIVRTFIPS